MDLLALLPPCRKHGAHQCAARCFENNVQRREKGEEAGAHSSFVQGGDQVPASDDAAW